MNSLKIRNTALTSYLNCKAPSRVKEVLITFSVSISSKLDAILEIISFQAIEMAYLLQISL